MSFLSRREREDINDKNGVNKLHKGRKSRMEDSPRRGIIYIRFRHDLQLSSDMSGYWQRPFSILLRICACSLKKNAFSRFLLIMYVRSENIILNSTVQFVDDPRRTLGLEMHFSAVCLRPTGLRSECDREERNDTHK